MDLSDTAGVRETGDAIEKIGVERAKKAVQNADAVIAVFDASSPWSDSEKEMLSELDSRAILVLNKTDLTVEKELPGAIMISCKTGEGIKELENASVRRKLPKIR